MRRVEAKWLVITLHMVYSNPRCVSVVFLGATLGVSALIYSLFDFISVLLDSTKFHAILKSNLPDLLLYVTLYTQITREQEVSWSQSANQFVEDEDEETFSYSVRISALELFQVCVISHSVVHS